jgi:NitT/TauT family transport system ATP-binding protein
MVAEAVSTREPEQTGIAVDVDHVTKTYETRDGVVDAVHDVSFNVPAGHVVSLVGPSGCGKSTVLKMMAGLVSSEKGSITVAGGAPTAGVPERAGRPAAAGRPDCGIMLQAPVLLPWRTVWENVTLPVEILRLDTAESHARARELLEFVGLSEFVTKYPWELSGGMQQRASLARLLVYDPQILLMDEPFAALDEFNRERLDLELLRLQERLHRTIVYVTHNIAEAVMLSDAVVVMTPRPGKVVDVVRVDLPRPRSFESTTTPEGIELIARIRKSLLDA